MTRTITMPDGEDIELSEAQATWIGLEHGAHPECDGCVLFGGCILHTAYPQTADGEP